MQCINGSGCLATINFVIPASNVLIVVSNSKYIRISIPFTNELEVWLHHSLFNVSYFHVQQLTAFKVQNRNILTFMGNKYDTLCCGLLKTSKSKTLVLFR